MRRILLEIAYDGTRYSGWQIQDNATTIEGVLLEALKDLLSTCNEDVSETELIGTSRTDAGVHAESNYAVFDTRVSIPGEKFSYALNSRLPDDIRVMSSREVDTDFHPRFRKSKKTYIYRIYNTDIALPTRSRYAHHVYEELNMDLMREAAKAFIGEHDFSAYCSAGAQVSSKVRTIEALTVSYEDDKMIAIEVTGNGFLYNMVRIIAGTLIDVGLKRRDIDTVIKSIETGDRSLAGPTAPAKGLTLKCIDFSEEK